MSELTSPLLQVNNLRVEFPTRAGTLVAVDNVSLQIDRGEVLGVVGESGAGKSMTGAAIIGLLEAPGRIADGEILFEGRRIDNLSDDELRSIRGRHIGAIFQDPLTSLNPLHTVGRQIIDTIVTHLNLSQNQARSRALELLQEVGIPAAKERIDHYPHQFSGGMRQRVVIALALCADPKLIIADEPTTALDVSIQAQIIALLRNLCDEHGTAIMLITHDMGVIAETADRVAVMYAGRVGEIGPVADIIHRPKLPYTVGLMGSIPSITLEVDELTQIDGSMPRLDAIPPGCRFHPRCTHAFARCHTELPELQKAERSEVACWLYEGPAPRDAKLDLAAPETAGKRQAAVADGSPPTPLVKIEGLKQYFDVSPSWLTRILERSGRQIVKAVDDLEFTINCGETFGLVGESGCGKSTVARAIVGLYTPTAGSISYTPGENGADNANPRQVGFHEKIQMIFQDPHASLNPRWKVADVISESIPQDRVGADRVAEPAATGGPRSSGWQKVPARVFRRPAPTHLHCPGPWRRAGIPHLR